MSRAAVGVDLTIGGASGSVELVGGIEGLLNPITALAQKFHAIADLDAVKHWDANALDTWAVSGASHGEKLTAQFILGVWNQWEEWQCGRFDVISAYGVWDAEHWAAFRTWADKPFTL